MIGKIKKIIRKIQRDIGDFNYRYINIGLMQSVPVLAFHWFLSPDDKSKEKYRNNRWYSNIEIFEEQIKWLSDNNYTFLSCDEYYNWRMWRKRLPRKSVLLTFDDGEESQLRLVEPILKKYNANGVCFVVGKFLESNSLFGNESAGEDRIEHISKKQMSNKDSSAMEYQSHTYDLHYRINNIAAVELVSKEEIENDFSKMSIYGFDYFAAPYGAYGKYLKSIVLKFYKLGFAINAPGNLYPTRFSNKNKINRIIIDDSVDLQTFVNIIL